MQKKTIAGLIALVAIAVVVMFLGYIEEETSISPNQTQPEETGFFDKFIEKQEKPDPYVKPPRLLVHYEYASGILVGATVNAIVGNRGGAGSVEVVLKVEDITKERKNIYLEKGEEKEISFFVPPSRGYYYGQRGKNTVTITIPNTDTGFTVTLFEPATPTPYTTPYIPPTPYTTPYTPPRTPYVPPSTPYIPPSTPYVPPSTPYIPGGQW
jgi:hypothetical protein